MLNFPNKESAVVSNNTAVFVISKNKVVKAEPTNAHQELIESIDKMILAISANQDVQYLAEHLKQKGLLSSIISSVSGANDKDIAGMVKHLGGSLETTQLVVQVMLRLQTQKYQSLREFHSALVEKIIKIQDDTKTLDGNQRSAAYAIVSALKDQVEDQMRQSEAVDRHELKIKEIDDVLAKAALVEVDFRGHLNTLDDQCANLKKSNGYVSCEVNTLQIDLKALAAESATSRIEVKSQARLMQKELHSDVASVREKLTSETIAFADLINQQTAKMVALECSLSRIETELVRRSTWSARLLRHSFGISVMLIAIAGLAVYSRV